MVAFMVYTSQLNEIKNANIFSIFEFDFIFL